MTGLSGLELSWETQLDAVTADSYWELYYDTFRGLETRAAARQLLHKEEFLAEMSDERVIKCVARDALDRVIGISTVTRHLETVPWISPAYFAHHYPEHTARDAVFYLGFTLVHRDHRHAHVFTAMLDRIVGLVSAENGVCGWDMCLYNDEFTGLGTSIQRLLEQHSQAAVVAVDRQNYYAVTYGRPAS